MKKFGLSKNERLKSKNEFDIVYSKGISCYSNSKKFKALLFFENSSTPSVKTAFAVHKKAGNAVWRNRVKRLLRAAFRQNKQSLIDLCENYGKFLLVVFSANLINKKKHPKLKLKNVMPEVLELIEKIENKIQNAKPL